MTGPAVRPVGGHEALPPPGPLPEAETACAPVWEAIYHSAPPAQQHELLSLARRQGLLYSHQVPPARNGAPPVDQPRQLLARLLAGQAADLEPVRPAAVDVYDTALDARQREAVARALHTPDLCLLQGLPGTGKSRVVAEIVTQAAARGERVLLLASSPATIDRVLELVGTRDVVCPVRCLGPDERPEVLPPSVRGLTFAERVRHLSEQPLRLARAELAAAEQRCERLRQAGQVVTRLDELAGQQQRLEQQGRALEEMRCRIPVEVSREAAAAEGAPGGASGTFAASIADLARAHGEALAAIDLARADLGGRIDQARREQTEQATRLDALRPLVHAKQRGRWWTGAWWRASFRGNVLDQYHEIETARQQAQALLDQLGEKEGALTRQREEAEAAFRAQRQQRVDAEATRRCGAIDEPEEACRQERARLREAWQAACWELDPEWTPPTPITGAGVGAAHEAWRRRVEQHEQQLAFTNQWVAYLEESAGTMAARLPEYVNLVAATTSALPGDEHFGDRSTQATGFDLLVFQEADLATESEFLHFANRAQRWVLVGEADGFLRRGVRRHSDTEMRGRGDRRRVAASPLLRVAGTGFFQRLWQHVHCDPRGLPYAWVQDGDRLCCRLRPVAPDQRQWVESERVADCPEIELRILTVPRGRPVLVEVVFPPSMTITEAKQYIYRELEELAVQAVGHSLCWTEEPDRVVLRLGETPAGNAVAVALEAGVRELVAAPNPEANGCSLLPASWPTLQVEFARDAGWDRERAQEWVKARLGVCDLGRTFLLDVPHRMHPDLAAFLSDLLFGGAYRLGAAVAGPQCTAVEEPAPTAHGACLALNGRSPLVAFLPVPPLAGDAGTGRHGDVPTPAPAPRQLQARDDGRRASPPPRRQRAGAGLELDLSDRRHHDRLPRELRPHLPAEGLVNYLEAQAVVRALETLAAEPTVRAAVESAGQVGGRRPVIAVLALYPAQVELIRLLVGQATGLADCGIEFEVGAPAVFREREVLVAVLSLTRSHAHHAVTFGDSPQVLALALTRASKKLILLGDPGTLVR
ncbi:MAG TPA: AAA domain-containing protein, partial [Gemmataceae bacterium]|nr:AAA domain-containing protein [Gemmataceae bacterium]